MPKTLTAEEIDAKLYNYKAYCSYVVDGDTIRIIWDLGKRMTDNRVELRFSRINTPERSEVGYEEAKQFVKDKLLYKPIFITTEKATDGGDKADNWDRYLAEIFYQSEEGLWININDELLEKGLARLYIK